MNQPLAFTIGERQYNIQSCDTIEWHFGDGTTETVVGATGTTHVYTNAGYYIVTATIQNSLGAIAADATRLCVGAGYVGFESNRSTAREGDPFAEIAVVRSNPSGTASAGFATSDSGGYAGTRYTSTTGTVTFNDGETRKIIQIPLINNSTYDGTAGFTVTLTPLTSGYLITCGIPDSTFVSVQDDELPPTISADRNVYFVTEGGSVQMTFTRTGDLTRTVSVVFGGYILVGPWGATQPVRDDSSLTFGPGETSRTTTFSVTDDDRFEGPRSLVLWVSIAGGGITTIPRNPDGFPELILTALDDESQPTLQIDDITVVEGDAPTTNAVFPVRLSGKLARDYDYSWSTSDLTGRAGFDYQASSGTGKLPAGQTLANITVAVIGNTARQTDRTFAVQIAPGPCCPAVAPIMGRNTAVCTVADDDDRPAIPTVDSRILLLLAVVLCAAALMRLSR